MKPLFLKLLAVAFISMLGSSTWSMDLDEEKEGDSKTQPVLVAQQPVPEEANDRVGSCLLATENFFQSLPNCRWGCPDSCCNWWCPLSVVGLCVNWVILGPLGGDYCCDPCKPPKRHARFTWYCQEYRNG